MSECDLVVVNVALATMRSGIPYGAVRDGALAVRGGRIAWAGARALLPRSLHAAVELDGKAGGFSECHQGSGSYVETSLGTY